MCSMMIDKDYYKKNILYYIMNHESDLVDFFLHNFDKAQKRDNNDKRADT